jgi:hypothetical protein
MGSGVTWFGSRVEPRASTDVDLARGSWLALLALAWLGGCSNPDAQRSQPEPSSASAALGSQDAAPAAPPLAPPDAATSAAEVDAGANEWREFARKDDVPVCLFTTWLDWQKAEFINQVKPNVTLRADHAINFGVYAPGCVSDECVQDPTLQCWADVEGSVITLHTRYSGREKIGATCTSGCLSAAAQCNTTLLPKGNYQIVYASDQFKVRVPSVQRPACLKR